MGWKLSNKPSTVKATKRLAEEFVEMDPVPHERPLMDRRLQVYQQIYDDGTFRPVTWAKAYCEETNGTYRVNGQHTATMIALLKGEPTGFYVTVECYVCDTLQDVARLYNTFDSKMQSRTVTDINLAFARTVPTLGGVAARTLNLCVSGINYWQASGIQSATYLKTPAERAEVLLDHANFVLWSHILYSSEERDSRLLFRQPVNATMFGTYQKDHIQASNFWAAVRNETGSSPDLPDRKLAHWLLRHTVGAKTKAKEAASSREVLVKCIRGWNAWRRKEATSLQYRPKEPVPELV